MFGVFDPSPVIYVPFGPSWKPPMGEFDLKRALSWFKRSRFEGLQLTLERITNRLTKKQRVRQRDEWLTSVSPVRGKGLNLDLLLPETTNPVERLIEQLQSSPLLPEKWIAEYVLSLDGDAVRKQADAISRGDLTSVHPLFVPGEGWNWHQAFLGTTSEWPSELARNEPISGAHCPGDVRLSWEKGRHQFLLNLLWAKVHTGDLKYLEDALSAMEDWEKHNPFPWESTGETHRRWDSG